jgi:hypothetical protein
MKTGKAYWNTHYKVIFLILLFSVSFIGQVLAYDYIEPFEPQIIEKNELLNYPGRKPSSKEYRCYLEAGHKYHVFLVGEWITNRTIANNATDYDIEVRNPNNVVVSINTESAGLPEQVANDAYHQYFIPSMTGDYRFIIYNDPEDSAPDAADAADFLIIEHLEMNTRYTTKLAGKPYVGGDYPPDHKIAYEFNTSEEIFQLFIEVEDPVPDKGITGLDMYEARIYPMANIEKDIGYAIQGIGVPYGYFLRNNENPSNRTMGYGGYNTSIEAAIYPEMRVSCESAGVDMKIFIQKPGGNSSANDNVFYYLVMLAEYFEGDVEFYMKTDYRSVNLTLVEPIDVGYSGETTLVKVVAESAAEIDSMWLEYTIDGWDSKDEIALLEKEDYWLAVLPSFRLNDNVEYIIHAKDEINNYGIFEGEFLVMNKVDIEFGIAGNVILGGQKVLITGSASKPSINLHLNIEHEEKNQEIVIQNKGDGSFSYEYTPNKIGEYDIYLSYEGDEDYHPTQTEEKSFRVDKRELMLTCVLSNELHKNKRPLEVSGKVTPPIYGLNVEFIFVTPETSFIETTSTNRHGEYSLTITPEVIGYWDMLPQLKVTELYIAPEPSMVSFEILKQTPVDLIKFKAMEFMNPPLVYAPIGLGVLTAVGLVMRTGIIKRRNGKVEEEVEVTTEVKEGATTYKRRSSR